MNQRAPSAGFEIEIQVQIVCTVYWAEPQADSMVAAELGDGGGGPPPSEAVPPTARSPGSTAVPSEEGPSQAASQATSRTPVTPPPNALRGSALLQRGR